jgi:heme/copper-type cytochrome/quinol oxidase subunit 2
MKKNNLKYLFIVIITLVLFSSVNISAADEAGNVELTVDRLETILNNIKGWFAGIIFIIGIIMMLYAAFLYMTSGGDDSKIEKAKKTLVWGIVGIIVALLAYGIWATVYNFLTAP